jgi:ribosome-interacting GTPase 1
MIFFKFYDFLLGEKDHGKSQLINTLRGTNSMYTMTSSCTSPMPYVYPFNSNIQFWELPPIAKDGRYKKDKFLKEINAERYDMVLMLTSNRFRTEFKTNCFFLGCFLVSHNVSKLSKKVDLKNLK